MGCAVKAVETVTFGGYKRGHLLYPGREYCGKVTLEKIGFHDQTIEKYASGFTLEEPEGLMPPRLSYSNKGTYGKILMITGNETMSGAAAFAGEAALRMGAVTCKDFVRCVKPADSSEPSSGNPVWRTRGPGKISGLV